MVAGHKKVENGNDPKIIAESQQYLRDFSRIAAEQTTTAGIVAQWPSSIPAGEPPHTMALRANSHRAEERLTRSSTAEGMEGAKSSPVPARKPSRRPGRC